MKFYGALVLMLTLSTACGLRCHVCVNKECEDIQCTPGLDRCATFQRQGDTIRSCFRSSACGGDIKCCSTDLCNSAIPTGSSVLLLLVSSVITAAFL